MKIDYSIFYSTLPGLALLVILESIEMVREHRFRKDKNDMLASLCVGVVAISITALVKTFVFFVYSWVYQFRLLTMPSNIWWVWIICFFGDDISYYWFHRCSHQIRFLWASHAVHHSAETFTLSAAVRLPW